jgi:predicted RND superfamily exporter protein
MKKRHHLRFILPAVLVLGITVFFGIRLPRLTFDYDLEKFFPKNDAEGKKFETFRNEFGSDYDYLLIGIGHEKSIYDTAFLQRVGLLSDSLANLEGVKSVISLPRLEVPLFSGLMARRKKLLHLNDPELLREDSILLSKSGMFSGALIGADNRSVCIYVETDPLISKKKSDVLLEKIETALAHFNFPDTFSGGKIRAQKYFLDKLTVDLFVFLGIASLVVILILLAVFRTFSGLWMPLVIVGFSLIWTLGIMEVTGKGIDILGSAIPCVMFVVSMSNAIHFYGKFRDEKALGKDTEEAVQTTFSKIGRSAFLTSLTTAVGFLSLLTTQSPPVMDFGIYCSAGVVAAYLITLALMPFFLRYFKVKPLDKVGRKSTIGWYKLWKGIEKRPRTVLYAFGLSSLVFLIGSLLVESNNRLTEDVRESTPLMQDLLRLEKEFSGVRPFEMVLEGDSLFSFENLKRAETFEKEAKAAFGLGFVQSHVTLAKMFNMAMHNGSPEFFKLPADREEYDRMVRAMNLHNVFAEDALKAFINEGQNRARISGKVHNVTGKEMLKNEKEFKKRIPEGSYPFAFEVTGSARLIDINIQNLTMNLAYGLSTGFILICLIIGVIFRSLRAAIISLLPNLFPLLGVAAILGFGGIPLKTSTAIIFTIGFGIAVDDTIHFLSRLRIELGLKKPFEQSLKQTFLGTGKAMALTTVVLVAGFLPLLASNFLATFYMGLLLCVLLILALLGDLFLLPVLLMLFPGKLKKQFLPHLNEKHSEKSPD